ncbi:hypothetical protein EV2_024949 [Malus domestica]
MEKLVNLVTKLNKMVRSSSVHGNLDRQVSIGGSPPPCAVHCEELFLPSKRVKGCRTINNDGDPDVAAGSHLAAKKCYIALAN